MLDLSHPRSRRDDHDEYPYYSGDAKCSDGRSCYANVPSSRHWGMLPLADQNKHDEQTKNRESELPIADI